MMKRFIEGEDRSQSTLFPEHLDDYITEDNPVRVIDVFVDELDLNELGFEGIAPEVTGRPAYHPASLLKIYIYGYLNRIQSSRRLERETQRNVELIWLTGRLMPDIRNRTSEISRLPTRTEATPTASGLVPRPSSACQQIPLSGIRTRIALSDCRHEHCSTDFQNNRPHADVGDPQQ
jgi:transposase